MDDGLKQRLIGAIVIIAAAIIFIPMIFDDSGSSPADIQVDIPQKPDVPKLEFSKPRQPEVTPEMKAQPEFLPETSAANPAAPGAPAGDAANLDSKPAASASGVAGWAVQLGSFEELENSETLRDKLRKAGYKAYIKYRPDRSPVLIQVFVGPELKRSAADHLQNKLQTEFALEGFVVRYEP